MITTVRHIVKKGIYYLQGKLTPHQFLIVASALVGITSGLAAVLLKYIVHTIEVWIQYYTRNVNEFLFFALLPIVGISLTVLFIRYALKGRFKKGSAEISFAIVKNSSVLPRSQMYSHLLTSAITVGFGGSVGLESPMVSTGSAIGSNFGRVHELSYKDKTILLACGAAAGIAAAFNSPIAGVLFAIEVLLADASAAVFIPLIIAAASGALISKIILKEGVILSFTLQQPFDYNNIPFYILLGLIAGFVSLYYAKSFSWVEHKVKKIDNTWVRIGLGGIILFILLIIFPPLYGEGYESIKVLASLKGEDLIAGSLIHRFFDSNTALLLFFGFLVVLKSIAAAVTIGTGGNGGSFGPSLFVGAYLGFLFARLINISGIGHIPEVNFALVAMAGILSGVFYAPLMAIFLIAEITGGYALIIPLMIVAALSVTVARYFQPLSMEGKKLAQLLKSTVDDRDQYLLSKLTLSEMIETNFSSVSPDDTLQALVKIIAKSRRNIYPVINENNHLVGLIHLDQVREVIFETNSYDKLFVRDLMKEPEAVIHPEETLHDVLKKFEDTGLWNLPVIENKQYKGFLSKSNILARYREEQVKSA
ncbi:MAG TPA: chloride channel protein [Cyclobacteriaceae bacterium]